MSRVSAPEIIVVPAQSTVDALVSNETTPFKTINAGLFSILDQSYLLPDSKVRFEGTDQLLTLIMPRLRHQVRLQENPTTAWGT